MQFLHYLRGSFPLLTFALGIVTWVFLPSFLGALGFQSKALFTFFMSLGVLSALLLPLGAQLIEVLKITV